MKDPIRFPNCNVLSILKKKKRHLRAHYSISLPSNTVAMQVLFHFRLSCLSDFCVAAHFAAKFFSNRCDFSLSFIGPLLTKPFPGAL